MNRIRVGLVGTGIGRSHAVAYRSLPELFELAAICDIDETRARSLADEVQAKHVVNSLDALCALDDIDVIDICTPPNLHIPQALQALASGKHVIVEKPLAASLQDADKLIAAEASSDRRVMPIFQYRFGHGLQKLRQLIAAGVAGRPYVATVETHWRRPASYYDVPWRGKWSTELGGALLGHAIHAHDLLTYVLGPIRSVYCRAATLVNKIEVEDSAAAALEMENGALVTLSITLGASDEMSRERFVFSGLTAESNRKAYASSGDPWTFTADSPELNAQIEAELATFQPLLEGFPGQLWRFYHALKDGTELPVTLTDARRSLELATALYDSSRSGQVVQLPLSQEHSLYAGWLPNQG